MELESHHCERHVSEESARPVDVLDLGERLSGLRLCEPAADERVRRSLVRHGQLTTVSVFDDGETLQIVDGFKRVRAARRLGWRSVRVSVLELGEAEATAAIQMLHRQRGLTALEEGWILRSLHCDHGLSQGAIAELVCMHKSWVCRRLMLVQTLRDEVQADVRLGLLVPRAAIALAALPRGNQQQAAALAASRGMTTRQVESLVRHLCDHHDSDEARQLAMQRWGTDGHALGSSGARTRPRSAGEQLIADIAVIMRVGVRLEVHLLDSPLGGLGANAAGHACESLRELAKQLSALERAIARALAIQEKLEDATLADA
jgi:ParB-like chromosome segregation protein Spo0J